MKMNSYNRLYGAYKLFFGALAAESRLHLLNAMRAGAKNVSELCRTTRYEQSLVSHNLKILEHHGMVFLEKKGKFRYYKLNEKTITPLLQLIDTHMKKYCCKILEGKR